MPLGICTRCEKLVPIVRLPLQPCQAQVDWAPVEHAAPDKHRGCGGVASDGFCDLCGERVDGDVVTPGATRCSGAGRAIR